MISTILFYTLFSSAILIYGIGLNTATIVCDSIKKLVLPFVKIISTVFSSSVLTWVIVKFILVPLKLIALYPFVTVLIFFSLSVFFESMIRIVTGKITSDYNFSFLVCLLALNESTNVIDVLLICFSCFLSFLLLLPLLYSLKNKIDILGNTTIHGNRKSLLLISIAIIIIAVLFGNVSWLNPGVLK